MVACVGLRDVIPLYYFDKSIKIIIEQSCCCAFDWACFCLGAVKIINDVLLHRQASSIYRTLSYEDSRFCRKLIWKGEDED